MDRKKLAMCLSAAFLCSITALSLTASIPNEATKIIFCFVYAGSVLLIEICAAADVEPGNGYLWILYGMIAAGNTAINLVPNADAKMFIVWGFLTVLGRIALLVMLITAHYRLDIWFAFLVGLTAAAYGIMFFESFLVRLDLILFFAAVQIICITARIFGSDRINPT